MEMLIKIVIKDTKHQGKITGGLEINGNLGQVSAGIYRIIDHDSLHL